VLARNADRLENVVSRILREVVTIRPYRMVNSRRPVRIAERKPMLAKSEKRAIAACFDAYFDTSAARYARGI
jgi:hypothetical protein